MQADKYLGISAVHQSEYKASGSKFYGYLFPVKDAKEFDQIIKKYKEKYADATHVCSACVVGTAREYQRCSDDGEPSNSSGRPILHAILSAEITYVGCAVVRYYGGKKLGIPGLIEAYGGAAQLCIESADIIELVETTDTFCSMDDSKSYLLYNFLNKRKDLTYEVNDAGQFKITCAKSLTAILHSELKKISTLAIIE